MFDKLLLRNKIRNYQKKKFISVRDKILSQKAGCHFPESHKFFCKFQTVGRFEFEQNRFFFKSDNIFECNSFIRITFKIKCYRVALPYLRRLVTIKCYIVALPYLRRLVTIKCYIVALPYLIRLVTVKCYIVALPYLRRLVTIKCYRVALPYLRRLVTISPFLHMHKTSRELYCTVLDVCTVWFNEYPDHESLESKHVAICIINP